MVPLPDSSGWSTGLFLLADWNGTRFPLLVSNFRQQIMKLLSPCHR